MNKLLETISLRLLRHLPAETAHSTTIKLLKLGLASSKDLKGSELSETISNVFDLKAKY